MSPQVDPRPCSNHFMPTACDWTREISTHHMPATSRVKTWPSGPGRPLLPDDGYIWIPVPRAVLRNEKKPRSVVGDAPLANHATQQLALPNWSCPYLVKVHCCKRGTSLYAEATSAGAESIADASTPVNDTTLGTLFDDDATADVAGPWNTTELLLGITPMLPSHPQRSDRAATPGSASVISLSGSHISQSHHAGGSSTPSTIRRVDSSHSDGWSFLESAHPGRPKYHLSIGSPNNTSLSPLVSRTRNDLSSRVAPFGTAVIIRGGPRKQFEPDSSGSLKRQRSSSGAGKDAAASQQADQEPKEKRAKLMHEQSNALRAATDHVPHPPSKLKNELQLRLSSHYM